MLTKSKKFADSLTVSSTCTKFFMLWSIYAPRRGSFLLPDQQVATLLKTKALFSDYKYFISIYSNQQHLHVCNNTFVTIYLNCILMAYQRNSSQENTSPTYINSNFSFQISWLLQVLKNLPEYSAAMKI